MGFLFSQIKLPLSTTSLLGIFGKYLINVHKNGLKWPPRPFETVFPKNVEFEIGDHISSTFCALLGLFIVAEKGLLSRLSNNGNYVAFCKRHNRESVASLTANPKGLRVHWWLAMNLHFQKVALHSISLPKNLGLCAMPRFSNAI